MSWDAARETMRQRRAVSTTAIGILGIAAGAVLLRRPVPLWSSITVIADGVLTAATGSGLITRAINRLVGKDPTTSTG